MILMEVRGKATQEVFGAPKSVQVETVENRGNSEARMGTLGSDSRPEGWEWAGLGENISLGWE